MHVTSEPGILYFGTPVVLISTTNEDGSYNLAPMSSAFWLGWRCLLGLAGTSKTTQNIMRTGECVLNLPSVDNVAAVESSRPHDGLKSGSGGQGAPGLQIRVPDLPPALSVIASSGEFHAAITVTAGSSLRFSRSSTSFNPAAGSRSITLRRTPPSGAHAEPRGWPGIGRRSEERPFFDGLCPAMTERA